MLTVLGLRVARSSHLQAGRIPSLQLIAQGSINEHLSGPTLDRQRYIAERRAWKESTATDRYENMDDGFEFLLLDDPE